MGAVLTLYGAAGSGSAAIEAALVLCGADYRVVTAATWEADSALDELRRANPLQQIPTLVLADGSVLTESAAILIHLGLTYPASNLLPPDPAARAQAIRALVYIAANCYAAIGVIDYPERWCADPAATESLRSGARARLHRYWDAFADTFGAPQPFFGVLLSACSPTSARGSPASAIFLITVFFPSQVLVLSSQARLRAYSGTASCGVWASTASAAALRALRSSLVISVCT